MHQSLAARNCVPCALRSTSGNELTYRAKTRIDSVCIAAVCPSVTIACVRAYTCGRERARARARLPATYYLYCSRRRAPPAAGGHHRVHEREHATEFRGAIKAFGEEDILADGKRTSSSNELSEINFIFGSPHHVVSIEDRISQSKVKAHTFPYSILLSENFAKKETLFHKKKRLLKHGLLF